MTLTALKISHLEQLNSKIFALLSTPFSRLKIEHLIKQIGITRLLMHLISDMPDNNVRACP
ncbi:MULTISPECIES: hypothetical protein [unclassified Pseudoalteromonas]|uniref:hypothetical protein n=1 Tax=unclassified Pseudoalteromonas TaxID=194690 RepID=UPI002096BF43|nr:hypothetical protein [Pseudoalteromonas sp. XMcav2-N]MCO7188291.1 hypothetical protein [Pseudoalteromonas sp. XMcav2-N]